MVEAVQVFWAPDGASMPSLGSRALVDVTDGDTPNLRMLSVDTPEVTARTAARAAVIDQEFTQLAQWIRDRKAPIEAGLAGFLLPKLETGRAGSLHFEQGQAASAFGKENITDRLARRARRGACSSEWRIPRSTTTTGCWPTSRLTTAPRNASRFRKSSGRRSTWTWSRSAGQPRL
jgi:hypothetical protein